MMHRTSMLFNSAASKCCTFQRSCSFSTRLAALPMASTATKAPLLFGQQQTTQQQPMLAKCAFSSTQKCFSVAQELKEALQREIKAELEMEEDNLGGKMSPSIPGFKIVPDQAEFMLTKMHGNEKISILVNVNHSVDIDEGVGEDMVGDDRAEQIAVPVEDMQHEPVPVSLPPFRVEITKGDQRIVFYLQMIKSEEGGYDYSVEEFMIAPAVKSADNKFEEVPEEVYSSSGKYIDQGLHELLFLRYLEERGFTTQFCHDLVKFATHYEHQQYVRMLEKLEKFVGEK